MTFEEANNLFKDSCDKGNFKSLGEAFKEFNLGIAENICYSCSNREVCNVKSTRSPEDKGTNDYSVINTCRFYVFDDTYGDDIVGILEEE